MLRLGAENPSPDESAIIARIIDEMLATQKAKHKPGETARRDVHSKSHGTFDAHFIVRPNVARHNLVGLFAQPGTYLSKIRFSNGTPGVGYDILPNVRGAALKVAGVPGKKLLDDAEDSNFHDFLLSNHPTLFASDLPSYAAITSLIGTAGLGAVRKQFPREFSELLKATLKLVKNPLTINYFSQTPYALGEGAAVKYVMFASQHTPWYSVPNIFSRDFLRKRANRFLASKPAHFVFCVQRQMDPIAQPVEDPCVQWLTNPEPVADLIILPHQSSGEERCERAAYNPWRVLAEHRPLGWANRARREIYRADALWRNQQNS